ncbi:hypothetical protein K2173_027016 [Erythroxylum novogranatense]|uniref:Uncharacterized protein n=1 Tax=Erythroxylum novogranatense TaxID=1862640 RepID=A0AAV8U131_9ROSI|nr:hypothetical protein K2173_027016 [Erythroxylum novogranatense]
MSMHIETHPYERSLTHGGPLWRRNSQNDDTSPSLSVKRKVGGFRACTFTFVLMALENMGFIANMVSMVLYFYNVMHFDIASSANTLTNFMGSTFLLSIVGGFISDAYLNRLRTILIFGVLEILALVMVTIQAYSKDLHPNKCGKESCVEGGIALMLYSSLCLLALGSGGVRGALAPFGADQFNSKDPKAANQVATYFNWATLSSVLGGAIGVTFVVWVSIYRGWYKGFLISTVATTLGFIVLVLGTPFYRLAKPGQGPLSRIIQVLALAMKNRRLPLPKSTDELYEISSTATTDKGAISTKDKLAHTNQFRFLDKAAIVVGEELKYTEGTVCTVTQVEEVKILARMLPILLSTIIMNTCLAQLQTFSVQQGSKMDLYLGGFLVPAPSVPVIPLMFMVILIPLYEYIFVPFARKITGHPSGITQLQRVGIGLVLSAISMAVAGFVEVKRRNQATRHPDEHPITLFWLSFQYGIFGIADMFTLVGLMEFFYTQAPSGMKSLSTSFTWLSLSFGYFLSTVFVDLINAITKRVTPSKQGWLHGTDLNTNNLNLFYWFLAILSCLNFANYVYWAKWYKYKTDNDKHKDIDEPTIMRSLLGDPSVVGVKKECNNTGTTNTDMISTIETTKTAESTEEEKEIVAKDTNLATIS